MNTGTAQTAIRIAVIADTHGSLPVEVAQAAKAADEVWHLGDFCNLAMLEEVRRIGPPVTAVLGNNDFGLDLPIHVMLERCGRTFRLIHIPPRQPQGVDFLLHGHTHVPRDEMEGTTRVLNPGTVGKANKGAPPSWAWLTIFPDGSVTWELVPVRRR